MPVHNLQCVTCGVCFLLISAAFKPKAHTDETDGKWKTGSATVFQSVHFFLLFKLGLSYIGYSADIFPIL